MIRPLLAAAIACAGLALAAPAMAAALGVALPLMLVIAEILYKKTRDPDYLEFAKRMAKGTAILFAVYVGYFLLRGAIEDPELRRKAAAAVGVAE